MSKESNIVSDSEALKINTHIENLESSPCEHKTQKLLPRFLRFVSEGEKKQLRSFRYRFIAIHCLDCGQVDFYNWDTIRVLGEE